MVAFGTTYTGPGPYSTSQPASYNWQQTAPSNQVTGQRQKSQSSSFQNSEGSSSSESGESYNPQQSAWISALYPQLKARFDTASPQTRMNQPFSAYSSVGGTPGNFTDIIASDVWSPQQIQQQVNQMRAQNSADAGGQTRQMTQRLAGAGFQSISPLRNELEGAIQGRALAASSGGENDLRFKAAEGNAANRLKGQGLQTQVELGRSADERARRAMMLAARAQDLETSSADQNALLQAMGYYSRPLQRAKSQSSQMAKGGSSSYSSSQQDSGEDRVASQISF